MEHPDVTRRILVSLDGGDLSISSIPYLRSLATPESDILLVRIVPERSTLYELLRRTTISAEDVQQSALEVSREYLEMVANEIRDISPNVSTITCMGSPADEILRIAGEENVSLILMATHGRGVMGRSLLGSVAERIAQSTTVPLMLVRPHPLTVPLPVHVRVALRRIVVPFDGSGEARRAFPVAEELADTMDVPIQLLRVLGYEFEDDPNPGIDAIMQRYGVVLDDARDLEAGISTELRAEADALRVPARGDVLVGPVAETLVGAIANSDLVVMTSHGMGEARNWRMGSIADKLIRAASSPVLLVPSATRR